MARPNKQGLDYFPYDVDLDIDDKIQMIIAEFGFRGEMIVTKLFAWIYKNGGYYINWDEKERLKFAARVAYISGSQANLVTEIVDRCIKWDLFNAVVFESFGILTSVRIQETWKDGSRKRKDRTFIPAIWLLMAPPDAAKAEETELKAEVTHKVKETKEKETKVTRPNGLVVSPETTDQARRQKKKQYTEILNGLNGAQPVSYWESIHKFIIDQSPDFAEPYVDAWNIFAGHYRLAKVEAISDSRRKKLSSRLQEKTFDYFRILDKAKSSAHLRGDNNGSWKITFDWVIENDKNYLKIIEGNYD